jgi:predicted branched-subunit amino acid permease
LAHAVPDLSALHLEFSIVAVFLVMAIMLIQNWAAAAGVMASSAAILLFSWLQLEVAILLAGLCGMLLSALIDQGAEQ